MIGLWMKFKLLTHSLICNLKFSLFSSDDIIFHCYFSIAIFQKFEIWWDFFVNLLFIKFVNYNVSFSLTVLSRNRRKFQINTNRFWRAGLAVTWSVSKIYWLIWDWMPKMASWMREAVELGHILTEYLIFTDIFIICQWQSHNINRCSDT